MPQVAVGTAGTAWMSRGACRREDPELFFPVELTSSVPLQWVSAAKAVCERCPVRRSCVAYALRTGQDGIWGGTTSGERRAMRRSPAGSGPGAA
jgi:WhiB family transcriptional regulator, redox-sensing transcriptional regulator